MKIKRIISSVMAVAMMLTVLTAAMATSVFAAVTEEIDGANFTGAQAASSVVGSFSEGNKYLYVSNRKSLGGSLVFIYSHGFTDHTYTIQYDVAVPFDTPNAKVNDRTGQFFSGGYNLNANNKQTVTGRAAWKTVTGHNYTNLGSDIAKAIQIGARMPYYGWGLNNGPEFDGFNYMIDNIKLVNTAGTTVFNFDFDNVVAIRQPDGSLHMSVADKEIDGVTYKGGALIIQNTKPINVGNPIAHPATLEIVTDENYYIATTDANNEIAYTCNRVFEPGVHTLTATVRNGQYVRASSSDADVANGTANFIIYDSANSDGYLVADNNKFDLGVNLHTATEVIECDTTVTNIGNAWTNVTFSFELEEEITVEKIAFEAHHILENATINMQAFGPAGGGNMAVYTDQDAADANAALADLKATVTMDFKNIEMSFEREAKKSSGGGIFMVLLCKKKAMVTE